MKIHSLKLRGAIGIRKGLGQEEVSLNFKDFAPGLVAISGRNGTGKTTIIENLHPYRCMVSRDGSLTTQFYLKDSYRVLEFEYNGKQYESKILIDALTGASEAYLFEQGKALNDGKLTTYDKAIEDLLGSRDLFFNSVFSGQKSKGIAQLKPAEIKTLFFELLNLNHYEVYCERAKEKLKEKQLQLSSIEGEIRVLMESVLDVNEADVLRGRETLQYLEDAILTSGNDLRKSQNRKDELQTELARTEAVFANYKTIEKEIFAKWDKFHEIDKGLERELERMKTEMEKEIAEVTKSRSHGDTELEVIEAKITRARKLMMNLETINANIAKKKELEAKLKGIRESIDRESQMMRNGMEHKQKLLGLLPLEEINTLEKNIFETELREGKLKKDLEKAEMEYRLIDEVPCDEITGSNCQFLKNAHLMKEAIPAIKNELESLYPTLEADRRALGSHTSRKAELEKEIDQFEQVTQIIRENERELRLEASRIETELADLERHPWENLLQEAQKAESDIRVHEMEIEALAKEEEAYRKELATIRERYAAIEDEKRRSAAEMAAEIKQEIERMEDEIDPTLEQQVNSIRFKLELTAGEIMKHTGEIELLNTRLKAHQAKLQELELRVEQAKATQAKINAKMTEKVLVETEINEYAFLVKAFDKTGIPVLKLENSGIEISSRANELLSLFENKFRIVFETTSWTKDKKKLKETFLINVVEEDGVCNLSDKSGGQQVWLETAIQLAISLVVRQQGRRIETSFLDEKDGALDIENAYSYMRMLEKAHAMSGVHNTFIITHRPELLELIGQKVVLKDGFLQTINN
ncbi:MAG: hypothetical protein J0L60_06725 [Ignavibacteria bacterium]|nr:hypothetical protein [Ignavibacteria bacterium]